MQFILSLDNDTTQPVHKQLSDAIRKAIHSGELIEGQLMPSIREISASLSVSRLAASRSYDELNVQGYLVTRNRGKTYVSRPIDFNPDNTGRKRIELSDFGQRLHLSCDEDEFLDATSNFGATPPSQLPIARFQECLRSAVSDVSIWSKHTATDSFGLLELREQLQALIFRTRGIQCSPEQIIVFPSVGAELDLLSRLTLRENDLVAVEDPSFSGIHRSFEINGANIRHIAVDSEGIRVDQLDELERVPRLVYVTPASQTNSGVVMTRLRRRKLLQWVMSNQALIIEDDIGSEFSYGHEPQPALFSQDVSGSVIYKYNFWKSLYPLVKFSFLVVPESLVPAFRSATNTMLTEISHLEQVALAAFIRKGYYEMHLHRCRNAYSLKRASLIQSLTKVVKYGVKFSQQVCGTYLTVQFPADLTEPAIELAADLTGLEIWSTQANYGLVEPNKNEYLVSFSNLDEAEIDKQICEFMRLTDPDGLCVTDFASGSFVGMAESATNLNVTMI